MIDESPPPPADAPGASGAAEDRRELGDESFRTFVRHSQDGIIIVDREGTILEWNEGEEAITGIPRAEALSRPIWEVQYRLAPDEHKNADFIRVASKKALAGLQEGVDLKRVLEEEIQRPDGTRRVVQSLLFGLRSGGRVLAGAICRDVTERRRLEEALREADRRKDEFLAVLSHELRNPLAPIVSSLHVLARAEPGGEPARRAYAVIERQVGHLTRLVDDLLDVTRISRGKIQLRREQLDLGNLVRRAIEDHRETFAARGVQLDGRLTAEPLRLDGDPTRLAQVAGNLLGNAAKFTPRGGRVEVTLERDDATAVLTVRDTGVGIAPELCARLFQPFIQAEQSLDRSSGGLGLGLTLVEGLVELHGGAVAVTSDGPGRGAAFTVRLPLEAAVAEPVRAAAPRPIRPRRVLIIEDNTDAAESLKDALEFMGHVVEVAADGPDGIAAARRFAPEVVLCDVGLPGMDGYEVARRFKAEPALRGAVLIALTGYALPEDRERAAAAGFAHHVAKPPGFEDLEHLLREA